MQQRGQHRTSNELRKQRVFISGSGVRSVWFRHNLENFKKRLKALERRASDDEACGEIETAHPGYLGSQDIFYVGNPGQLDGQGVVTRGAGDGIRIDVRAADTQADFRGRITQANHEVKYPVDFAAKGQFRFRAQPVFPADVKAGEYNGALTFVVTALE